jgi:hypothetical protein
MNFKFLIQSLFFCVLLNSCSEGVEKTSAVSVEKEQKCSCSDLIEIDNRYYLGGQKYTGNCEEFDASDHLVKSAKHKNGYLLERQRWKEVVRGEEYVKTEDIKFHNNRKDEGFKLTISKLSALNKSFSYIVKRAYIYEQGIEKHYSIDYIGEIQILGDDEYTSIGKECGDGLNLGYFVETNDVFQSLNSLSEEERNNNIISYIKCIENSKTLPMFRTWNLK